MDRVTDFESGGCAFDPRRGHLFMPSLQPDVKMILMLLDRLEHIPADSAWAHRASGMRGALIRMVEQMEMGNSIDPASLKNNVLTGFQILNEVAKARSRNQVRFYRRSK